MSNIKIDFHHSRWGKVDVHFGELEDFSNDWVTDFRITSTNQVRIEDKMSYRSVKEQEKAIKKELKRLRTKYKF